MIEPRDYTAQELLAWCRFLALGLTGAALAYAREHAGSVDDFVDFATERLAAAWAGQAGGGVEAATLGLLLNVEAIAGKVQSRAINPEEGALLVTDLPGSQVAEDLAHRFDLPVAPEDILALAGVSQEEMNQLYDVFGRIAAAAGVEYRREPSDGGQRLTLRVW